MDPTLDGEQAPAATARQSTLRETNLAVVLRCVCASDERLSRAGVSARTGLARATVSRLVDELVSARLLEEGEAVLSGIGRPGVPLSPAAGTVGGLGLQVNAAHVAARLVDLRGEVVAESRSEPDLVGSSPAEGLDRLADHVREVLTAAPEGMRILGAGLALPGIVDRATGRLLVAPNLAWRDLDPHDHEGLAGALHGIPLFLGNEATLAAHATAQPRPGRRGPHSDFVYVSGEIGVGGAFVVDGEVQVGRRGFAGELGHVAYLPDGEPCACGSRGCLERYAGRLAMTERAGLPAGTGLATLEARAREGHRGSVAAVELAAEALGVVLAGAVNLLDVPTVVLGGEIGEVADLVAPRVLEVLRERVLAAEWIDLAVERDGDHVGGATGAALRRLVPVLARPAEFVGKS